MRTVRSLGTLLSQSELFKLCVLLKLFYTSKWKTKKSLRELVVVNSVSN